MVYILHTYVPTYNYVYQVHVHTMYTKYMYIHKTYTYVYVQIYMYLVCIRFGIHTYIPTTCTCMYYTYMYIGVLYKIIHVHVPHTYIPTYMYMFIDRARDRELLEAELKGQVGTSTRVNNRCTTGDYSRVLHTHIYTYTQSLFRTQPHINCTTDKYYFNNRHTCTYSTLVYCSILAFSHK